MNTIPLQTHLHPRGLRVLFAGGGTGGHLCPAVGVARLLREEGAEVLFLGSDKPLERRILEPAGLEHVAVPSAPFSAARPWRFLFGQLRGLGAAWRVVREFRPGVVLGLGGFVSAPGVLAARLQGIPVALFEPNAVPGRANEVLSRLAREAYSHWEGVQLGRCPVVRTGAPLGDGVRHGEGLSQGEARLRLGLPEEGRVLLVMGGSQGARALNGWLSGALPRAGAAARGASVLHLAGNEVEAARLEAVYRQSGVRAVVRPFLAEIGLAYRAADLAVVRGGAATLAELAAVGLPALVVPLPTSAGDHQRANARGFAASGAGELLEEDQLDEAALERVLGLLQDEVTLAARRARALAAGRPEAAREVARRLRALAGCADTREDEQRLAA